jgi:exopolyphosphatase/guanosine-5'-triphosphate,3'-diphosphate pyrophosphatase
VRLKEGKVNKDIWKKIKTWINENINTDQEVIAIGTGGNISKIFEFVYSEDGKMAHLDDLIKTVSYLDSFTETERINKLKMNPDRADVIVPASEIYLSVMKWAKANRMFVPDLGLKDGILLQVYNELSK